VGTHKVVATMKHSNNVSPASPYLIDIRFGVDEGPMKICSVRSVGFEILVAVGVFIRGNNQLALFTIISTSSYVLFYCKVWRLQFSDLMMKDGKPAFLGGFLQPIYFQCVLDLVVSNERILRSSKPCMAREIASVPFRWCLFGAFFNLRQARNDQRKKMTGLIFNVLLFLVVILCQVVLLYELLFSLKYIIYETIY